MEQEIITNFRLSKDEVEAKAAQVNEQIIDTFQSGKSFLVEAGAGAGKTYSLNKLLDWVQNNKQMEYDSLNQKVVCITFTNAAVNIIKDRLSSQSVIVPSTIHSFVWSNIKMYQTEMIKIATEGNIFSPRSNDGSIPQEVIYDLGCNSIEAGKIFLSHSDVLNFFCRLLDNEKYRALFAHKYPLILIDEYQDSYKSVIDSFIKFFIASNTGPQFGFFGDSWQNIYIENQSCGAIQHENLIVINKTLNFRSAPKIVKFLNYIRNDLIQYSSIDDFNGEVTVIHCNDYDGFRRSEPHFKDELPISVLQCYIDTIKEYITSRFPNESLKVLMPTHSVLANQQGYSTLMKILNKRLINSEDKVLLFFMNEVEPIYNALDRADMPKLFDTLKNLPKQINTKAEKRKWSQLKSQLAVARQGSAFDILNVILDSDLLPVPKDISDCYQKYRLKPDSAYCEKYSIKDFLDVKYSEFLAAINFLRPDSVFSTDHGVKGEEYDNVIFVVGRGWNLYQFDKYVPKIKSDFSNCSKEDKSFIRNRNLFYVCCSRARKRLYLFVTIPLNGEFLEFFRMADLDNICTYTEFINNNLPQSKSES